MSFCDNLLTERTEPVRQCVSFRCEPDQPHAHGRALLMDAHPRNTVSHDDRFAAFGDLLARPIQRSARFSTIAELAPSALQQQATGESSLRHRT